MFHCPLCQHAAHARTSRYITDTTKERYHQCQNVNCSATFITYESVRAANYVDVITNRKPLSRGAFFVDVVNVWT